jgi:hypothetical protein
MLSLKLQALAALLVAMVAASPCPYGDMAERGLLPRAESDKFFAARSEGEAAVEHQLKERAELAELEKREFARQEQYYKRQVLGGLLNLGGGLLNGVLQPFTGSLAGLGVPT